MQFHDTIHVIQSARYMAHDTMPTIQSVRNCPHNTIRNRTYSQRIMAISTLVSPHTAGLCAATYDSFSSSSFWMLEGSWRRAGICFYAVGRFLRAKLLESDRQRQVSHSLEFYQCHSAVFENILKALH